MERRLAQRCLPHKNVMVNTKIIPDSQKTADVTLTCIGTIGYTPHVKEYFGYAFVRTTPPLFTRILQAGAILYRQRYASYAYYGYFTLVHLYGEPSRTTEVGSWI